MIHCLIPPNGISITHLLFGQRELFSSFRQKKTDAILEDRRKLLDTFLAKKIGRCFFLDDVSKDISKPE